MCSNGNWQGRRRRTDHTTARMRDDDVRPAGKARRGMESNMHDSCRLPCKPYRDMTVYPETDDEADGNRREVYRGSLEASDNKVNGVGGLHSGLQARAQVICGGATDAVARQAPCCPRSSRCLPGISSWQAHRQGTRRELRFGPCSGGSVGTLPSDRRVLAGGSELKGRVTLARLSVTPARRPAGRTPFTSRTFYLARCCKHKIRRTLFAYSEQVRPIYLPVPRRTTHRI